MTPGSPCVPGDNQQIFLAIFVQCYGNFSGFPSTEFKSTPWFSFFLWGEGGGVVVKSKVCQYQLPNQDGPKLPSCGLIDGQILARTYSNQQIPKNCKSPLNPCTFLQCFKGSKMSQLAKLEIFNPRQYAILNAKAYEAIRRNRAGVIATAPPAAPPEVG